MDDVSSVGGARKMHERDNSLSGPFAFQPKHAGSPTSAVVSSVEMNNAVSMAEEQEIFRCPGTRVPQINSQSECGEISQRHLSAEAAAEPTTTFQEPHLLLPVISVSHSVVATDYALGAGESKGPVLSTVSVSGSHSSLPSSLPCVAVPPSGTSFSSSAAFPEGRADSRMPVEGARGAPSTADRVRVCITQDEDCTRQGTFAGKSSGTLYEKQTLMRDSHDAAQSAAILPGFSDNDAQANRRRSGSRGYSGGGEAVSSWSKGHGLPLGKQCPRNGERTCEDLPEIHKCGGGQRDMDRETLVRNAEDAILARATAMKDNQTTGAVQVSAEGRAHGNRWQEVEAHSESNSVRRNNVAVRPFTGAHRSKPVCHGQREQSTLTNAAIAGRPCFCGASAPQHFSAVYMSPVSSVCRPASEGMGAASADICERKNRPFSEICDYSEEYEAYLPNVVRCGPPGGRLTNVEAQEDRATNEAAAEHPPDPATSQGEHREINLSQPELSSAHVTESANASEFHCKSDEAAATTEVLYSSSTKPGKAPQSRLVQQGSGTLVPPDGTRIAFPPSVESVDVMGVQPHDANRRGKNLNGQGLQDVVSLQPHSNTGEGRSSLSAHERRKHSMEGPSRSERSTAAGSYCEISSESGLYSGPSVAQSESSVESAATLKDFCGRAGERIVTASVAANETALVEKHIAAQESHNQGSAGAPCLPLRNACERNTNESTEETSSSRRSDQEHSSTEPAMNMGVGHTGAMQTVRGQAGGELIRPGTLTQQHLQQQFQRRQLQQRFQRQHSEEHNLIEQYYRQQQLEQQSLRQQQQQLEQQNLRQQEQLAQQELRKQQLEQQNLRQELEQQHLKQHQLREQHLWEHIHELQLHQKRQQEQQTRGQEKLPLNNEYQHQQQRLEQLQRQQQELERHQRLPFNVRGWMGQYQGLYTAATPLSVAPAQLAANSYKSMRQATTLALMQDKRGGSTAGEVARVTVAGGEQASTRKVDELLASGDGASQDPIHAAKAKGGDCVSQAEKDEISARFFTGNAAEGYAGVADRKPVGGALNSVASERKSSRCSTQDAAADAGSRRSRSAQHEEKKDAQDRAGEAVADSLIGRKPAPKGSPGEEPMQRKWSGNSSSLDTERDDKSQTLSSQEALVEQCCDDIWYHHGAKCYVVSPSHGGERRLFLFSEKKYGKELAQALAVACQKNRLTPEQLALGVPLRHAKDADAAALVSCINGGLKTCFLFSTGEDQPTLEGPAAGERAAEAMKPEEAVGSWWTRGTPRGDPEADAFPSRYPQHAMQLQRQQLQRQQQQRQHEELRQQQALRQHQELRQQQQELGQQEEEQQRQQLQKLKQQELREQQGEELQQPQEELRQHAAKGDAAVQPQEADVLPLSQMQQVQVRQEELHVPQQHALYERQEEFQQQQQHDALVRQRQQRETQVSATQHQVDWDAADLLEGKNERAARLTEHATAAAAAALASPFEHPSPGSDEQQELRTEEHQQQQATSSAADAGDVSASFHRSKPKEDDSTAATSVATRMPRKRTLSRRAADTDKGGVAARKRARNTLRSYAHVQDEGITAAEAYKAGNRETPHGVWFNSHTKSWTCATVGPRRQLLVFSSARYGFEAARALAVEARIRSVQALQEQQQQQLQQQEQQQQEQQQKQSHAEQQQLHRQEQRVSPQQHYLQSQQLYGQEQGQPVGVENSQEQQQHEGGHDRQPQQQTGGWADNMHHNKSSRNAHRSDDLRNNCSNNAVQTRGRSYEQCTAAEGAAVTTKNGKEVSVAPEAWTFKNTCRDAVESAFGEPTEGRSFSHRSGPEGVRSNSRKWSLCGMSNSNSSGPGMTEKEEQLLYAGKAAISLVLSDLLEVCLPQIRVLSAHTRNELRTCVDSALWRVHAAAHPADLQPFFNLFGACFLRAKAPSSLPLNLRVHYLEALSGLRLPLCTEEQQSAAVHAGAADIVDEAEHAVAAD